MFAELIPGAEQFEWIKNLFPQVAHFGKGNGPVVFNVKDVQVAPSICYDALVPSFFSQAKKKGAQVFVNITNDSWYGEIEAQQHLSLATFRSIETRTPLIRVANTGISTVIDIFGQQSFSSAFGEKKAFISDVFYSDSENKTLFVRFGDWFFWILGLLVVFGFVFNAKGADFLLSDHEE
jgi:apolipoprotein N-acyltransferase